MVKSCTFYDLRLKKMVLHPQTLYSSRLAFWGSLFLGLSLGACYALTYKFHTDISQMIDRGLEFALHGNIIFFGNASSGGMGKVPGGISSLLVGVPLKILLSPFSVLVGISLCHLASFAFIWQVFKNYFAPKTMWIFILLFWLSPWRVSEIYIWNPTYLFLATGIHLFTAARMEKRASFTDSFFHMFSMWFAFQIHNSSIILLLISCFLFFKGKIRIHWWGFIISGLIGIATLIPYLLALLDNPENSMAMKDDRYFLFRGLLYVFPILKAIWYWVRFSTTVFPKHIFQNLDLVWLGGSFFALGVSWLVLAVQYALGVLTALWSFRFNYVYWKKPKNRWLDSYVGCAFYALLVAAAISPIDFIFWHLIILFPIALVPVLDYVDWNIPARKAMKIFLAGLCYFSIYNVVAGMGSQKHSFKENPSYRFSKKIEEFQ